MSLQVQKVLEDFPGMRNPLLCIKKHCSKFKFDFAGCEADEKLRATRGHLPDVATPIRVPIQVVWTVATDARPRSPSLHYTREYHCCKPLVVQDHIALFMCQSLTAALQQYCAVPARPRRISRTVT